jgi:hypothetical protein
MKMGNTVLSVWHKKEIREKQKVLDVFGIVFQPKGNSHSGKPFQPKMYQNRISGLTD